ncbi:MAG TPA: hypothetical protein VD994_18105 [Prosthecobacter sp.]|nr:hypothetical protein [Prosthecobacter sp.]
MQGLLWLLLQMALLLLAAAVVFFWLGWRWRGQKAFLEASRLDASVDAESSTAERALQDKHAAHTALAQHNLAANREAAELREAREHQRNLEREILRLSEELKATRPPPPVEAAAPATPPPAVADTPPPEPEIPPPPKPARTKKSAPAPAPAVAPTPETKPAHPRLDPREVLAGLRAKISSQQVLVGALNQEREGWHQRVEALRPKAATDTAGFALTSKNLARSETQYKEAVTLLKNLQKQSAALERTLAAPAPQADDDDLTQIKGIKTALDQQLRAFGIRTYRQIALLSPDDLQAFSELLSFKNRAQRDHWQSQARDLHRAKYGADPA